MGLLVLSRRIGERIKIGDDVEIFVTDIYRDKENNLKVDIAFDAPKKIKILRKEKYLEDLKRNGTKPRN